MATNSFKLIHEAVGAKGTRCFAIERCASVDHPGWLALREALWPRCSRDEHLAEMAAFIADPQRYVQFVACVEAKLPVGFAEASVRHDYVNGTQSSPAGFLEGIYVAPPHRRRGIARGLVEVVEQWAASRGCRELASDTALENELSRRVHAALGFRETERIVYFNKPLR